MRLLNLHTSDPSVHRGMPPVFWEIREGMNAVTLTLHELILELDAGPVVAQRDVPIQWRPSLGATIGATRRMMAEEIATLLAESLPEILAGRRETRPLVPGPLRTVPSISDTMRAVKICRHRSSP
jgi:methionyl-tRNA formyltransferase